MLALQEIMHKPADALTQLQARSTAVHDFLRYDLKVPSRDMMPETRAVCANDAAWGATYQTSSWNLLHVLHHQISYTSMVIWLWAC